MAFRPPSMHEDEPRPGGLLGATHDQTRPDLDEPSDDVGLDDDLTPPPHAIGRFVVLRRVGRGSMGEVFSAFDDELGRRVAIKLLRRQPRAHEPRRARMRREAQAMAQVSHPNVIKVFEVGEHGDRTFIAMEYVEGQTLERWQQGARGKLRARAEILDAYLQAGAGLAAAHRAGVLHRDFKPSNVLVDAEGHAHVMDFGLAAWLRRADASLTDGKLGSSSDDGVALFDSREGPRLTRAGAVVGTPAFMSPEQFLGQPLDARSDQFAFCVALWEALAGVHPFGDDDVGELRTNVLQGKVREGASSRPLPPVLRRALLRGLARSPGERWPDMDALLGALRPRPRRVRWPLAVAAVVALAVAGVGYGVAQRSAGLCEGGPEQLARVWNDEARAAAHDGFMASGASLADGTWQRVEAALDAYAGEWAAARQRVCEATHVHGEQSAERMDQRMACLDLRLHAMTGLLSSFEQMDLEMVLRAVDASAGLPDVDECERAGVEALVDPEQARPEANELHRRLVTARARFDVGRMQDASVELEAIHDEALALGLTRLAAEVLMERGKAEEALGRVTQADALLERGFWQALARGHDHAAFEAAITHLELVGVTLGDATRGRAGIERSETLLLRLGEPDALRVDHLAISGAVLARHGDHREAKARLDEALALARRLYGTEHVTYGRVLNTAGIVALLGGDLDAAKRTFEDLVALDQRLYDADHTEVASALSNLAVVSAQTGDAAGAEQSFRRVLEIRRRVLGEGHVAVGDSYVNLAGMEYQRGSWAAALEHLERARTIYAASMREGAAKLNDADVMRSMVLVQLDRHAEAEATLRDVLARQRESLGERHPDLTRTLTTLGRLLTRPADATEAAALLRSAIEIQRDVLERAGAPLDQDAQLQELGRDLAKAEALARGEPAPADGPAPSGSPPQ